MTEFITVRDGRAEKPETLDTSSSAFVVYERKNIRQETTELDGVSVTEWVYEQRTYTQDEYMMMLSPAVQGIQRTLSELELAIAMR